MFFEFVSDCPSELQCAVCLSPFDNPVELLPCRHLLCSDCWSTLNPSSSSSAPTPEVCFGIQELIPKVIKVAGSITSSCPECRGAVKGTMPAHRHFHALVGRLQGKCTCCHVWSGTRDAYDQHELRNCRGLTASNFPKIPREEFLAIHRHIVHLQKEGVAAPPVPPVAPPAVVDKKNIPVPNLTMKFAEAEVVALWMNAGPSSTSSSAPVAGGGGGDQTNSTVLGSLRKMVTECEVAMSSPDFALFCEWYSVHRHSACSYGLTQGCYDAVLTEWRNGMCAKASSPPGSDGTGAPSTLPTQVVTAVTDIILNNRSSPKGSSGDTQGGMRHRHHKSQQRLLELSFPSLHDLLTQQHTILEVESTVEMLIHSKDHHGDVNSFRGDGHAPIHILTDTPLLEELLVRHRADPNLRTQNGNRTPLHLLAARNDAPGIRLLIQHGASLNAATEKGWTALHIASFLGAEAAVRALLSSSHSWDSACGSEENSKKQNAKNNKFQVLRIDANTGSGRTPLHLAIQANYQAVAQLLVKSGANKNYVRGTDGKSALQLAAEMGMRLEENNNSTDSTRSL